MSVKKVLKYVLKGLHLDVTKNLKYDRLTQKVMSSILKEDSNCIDIGCHKGEILSDILKLSPKGTHFAFEPVPFYYKLLKAQFDSVSVFPFALSNENKLTKFHFVKNAPAYSGINKREYAIKKPQIEEIEVEMKKLDEVIPEKTKIDFIKIDVEGAELNVLKGGVALLKKSKPYVIFEFGLGASDFYNSNPKELFSLLVNDIGLEISTLQNWLTKKGNLSEKEFINYFNTNKEYYFIAHPKR